MRALAALSIAAIALWISSCAMPGRGLPDPGPPNPSPVRASTAGGAVGEPIAAPAPPPQNTIAKPRFLAAVFEGPAGQRVRSLEHSARLVTFLKLNGFPAGIAEVKGALPSAVLEAAEAAAREQDPSAADVFLYGEVTLGDLVELRLAAYDMKSKRDIENCGRKGPGSQLNAMLDEAIAELVPIAVAKTGRR